MTKKKKIRKKHNSISAISALSIRRCFRSTYFTATICSVNDVAGECKIAARWRFCVVCGCKLFIILRRCFVVIQTATDRLRNSNISVWCIFYASILIGYIVRYVFRWQESCVILLFFRNFFGGRWWIHLGFTILRLCQSILDGWNDNGSLLLLGWWILRKCFTSFGCVNVVIFARFWCCCWYCWCCCFFNRFQFNFLLRLVVFV